VRRCVLLAAALACTAAIARQDEDIRIDAADIYYEVEGTTDAELLDDLRREAASVEQQYFAEAIWHVSWTFGYDQPVRGVCRIAAPRVLLIQRTTLPRWAGAQAPTDVAARWNAFVDAVRVHERGHTDHGLQAARAVRDALKQMRAADCTRLGAEANRAGAAIVERHAQMDRAYDAATEHGRSQGASWQGQVAPPMPAIAPAASRPREPRPERPAAIDGAAIPAPAPVRQR
jgi:predicted secreted Zn-dependent protease